MTYSYGFTLMFLFSNQLRQKIILRCSFNENEIYSYVIDGNTRYYHGLVRFRSVGEVVFTARTVDGNDVVPINGDQNVKITITGDKYLYRSSMFTFDEGTILLLFFPSISHYVQSSLKFTKCTNLRFSFLAQLSGLTVKQKYSMLFTIVNTGAYDVMIYYQSKKFQLNAGRQQDRTFEIESFYQPPSFMIWASPLAGNYYNQKFPVMEVLPVLGGSTKTIFVGEDCK